MLPAAEDAADARKSFGRRVQAKQRERPGRVRLQRSAARSHHQHGGWAGSWRRGNPVILPADPTVQQLWRWLLLLERLLWRLWRLKPQRLRPHTVTASVHRTREQHSRPREGGRFHALAAGKRQQPTDPIVRCIVAR